MRPITLSTAYKAGGIHPNGYKSGPMESRTPDLMLAEHAFYQLNYRPKTGMSALHIGLFPSRPNTVVPVVRLKGLEPIHLAALAPKASVSTIPPRSHHFFSTMSKNYRLLSESNYLQLSCQSTQERQILTFVNILKNIARHI